MNAYLNMNAAVLTATSNSDGIASVGAISMWSVTGGTDIVRMREALAERGLLEFADAVCSTSPMTVFHAVVSRYQKRQHVSGDSPRTIVLVPILKSRRDKASYGINLAVGQGLDQNDLSQVGSVVFDGSNDDLKITIDETAAMTDEDRMALEKITGNIRDNFEREMGFMSATDMNLLLNKVMQTLPGATKLIRSRQDWFVPNLSGCGENPLETMSGFYDALRQAGTGLVTFNFPVPNLPQYTEQVTTAVTSDIESTLAELEAEFVEKVGNKATRKRAFRADYIERVQLACAGIEYRCAMYEPVLSSEFVSYIKLQVELFRGRVAVETSK